MHPAHRVTWPVPVDPSGSDGPTRARARGVGWRRSSRGLFVPRSVDADLPEQRICEAAAVLPDFGGVTGWAALRWAGGVWFGGTTAGGLVRRPVTLAVGGKRIPARPGVAISQESLGLREIVEVDGVRTVDALRALFFETRYATSLWAAVEAVDMAAYSDVVSLDEFTTYVGSTSGWTGIDRARRACALADENSWSPRETWLRLVWVLVAGLGRPLCNMPIFDREGRHVGTPDLLDPETGLACEYDGALHLSGSQRRRDIARHDAFRQVGLEVVVAMAGETDVVAAQRILEARERSARRAASYRIRHWTIDRPTWWVDTDTVEQRRALGDFDRDRWLRLRLRVS